MNAALPADIQSKLKDHGLVLYDGECGFCQFWVQFILKRDLAGYFLFAPLQAEWTRAIHGRTTVDFDTMYLYDQGVLYQKSSAALRIAGHLPFPWDLAAAFRIVPLFIRDSVYSAIAKRRHSLQMSEACPLPTPEQRARFL